MFKKLNLIVCLAASVFVVSAVANNNSVDAKTASAKENKTDKNVVVEKPLTPAQKEALKQENIKKLDQAMDGFSDNFYATSDQVAKQVEDAKKKVVAKTSVIVDDAQTQATGLAAQAVDQAGGFMSQIAAALKGFKLSDEGAVIDTGSEMPKAAAPVADAQIDVAAEKLSRTQIADSYKECFGKFMDSKKNSSYYQELRFPKIGEEEKGSPYVIKLFSVPTGDGGVARSFTYFNGAGDDYSYTCIYDGADVLQSISYNDENGNGNDEILSNGMMVGVVERVK